MTDPPIDVRKTASCTEPLPTCAVKHRGGEKKEFARPGCGRTSLVAFDQLVVDLCPDPTNLGRARPAPPGLYKARSEIECTFGLSVRNRRNRLTCWPFGNAIDTRSTLPGRAPAATMARHVAHFDRSASSWLAHLGETSAAACRRARAAGARRSARGLESSPDPRAELTSANRTRSWGKRTAS